MVDGRLVIQLGDPVGCGEQVFIFLPHLPGQSCQAVAGCQVAGCFSGGGGLSRLLDLRADAAALLGQGCAVRKTGDPGDFRSRLAAVFVGQAADLVGTIRPVHQVVDDFQGRRADQRFRGGGSRVIRVDGQGVQAGVADGGNGIAVLIRHNIAELGGGFLGGHSEAQFRLMVPGHHPADLLHQGNELLVLLDGIGGGLLNREILLEVFVVEGDGGVAAGNVPGGIGVIDAAQQGVHVQLLPELVGGLGAGNGVDIKVLALDLEQAGRGYAGQVQQVGQGIGAEIAKAIPGAVRRIGVRVGVPQAGAAVRAIGGWPGVPGLGEVGTADIPGPTIQGVGRLHQAGVAQLPGVMFDFSGQAALVGGGKAVGDHFVKAGQELRQPRVVFVQDLGLLPPFLPLDKAALVAVQGAQSPIGQAIPIFPDVAIGIPVVIQPAVEVIAQLPQTAGLVVIAPGCRVLGQLIGNNHIAHQLGKGIAVGVGQAFRQVALHTLKEVFRAGIPSGAVRLGMVFGDFRRWGKGPAGGAAGELESPGLVLVTAAGIAGWRRFAVRHYRRRRYLGRLRVYAVRVIPAAIIAAAVTATVIAAVILGVGGFRGAFIPDPIQGVVDLSRIVIPDSRPQFLLGVGGGGLFLGCPVRGGLLRRLFRFPETAAAFRAGRLSVARRHFSNPSLSGKAGGSGDTAGELEQQENSAGPSRQSEQRAQIAHHAVHIEHFVLEAGHIPKHRHGVPAKGQGAQGVPAAQPAGKGRAVGHQGFQGRLHQGRFQGEVHAVGHIAAQHLPKPDDQVEPHQQGQKPGGHGYPPVCFRMANSPRMVIGSRGPMAQGMLTPP